MFNKKIILSIACGVLLFLSGCSKKLSEEQMVERGKYLVNACGILAHHTPPGADGQPDFNKYMAGNKNGYKGPWGICYTKNLTPDNDTGIGMMTDEEVINLIKNEGSGGRAPL